MKKLFTLLVTAILAVTCAFGLTACGDDETKIITVGYTEYPPMNYVDDSGELVGFDTELAEKVFTDLGYEVIFLKIEWKQKYTDLNTGRIDCIWNGFTSNSDDDGVPRSQSVDFTYNYMQNAQCIITKDGANLTSWEDLVGKSVAFETDSAADSLVTGAIEDFKDDVLTVGKITQMDAITSLNTGMVDYAVVDVLLADSILAQPAYSELSKVTGIDIGIEYYAVGFKKGSELTAQVNAKFVEYVNDGSMMQLATKYKLENAVLTDFATQN